MGNKSWVLIVRIVGFNMSKDKDIFVTIIMENGSTIFIGMKERRSGVKGVGKMFAVVIVGF